MININNVLKSMKTKVDYIKLEELLDYIQPTKYIVENTDYDDSYSVPVLTAGQTLLLGYTNDSKNIFEASKLEPVIIFDDFTTSHHWIDYPFKVKSSAMKMLINKTNNNFKYIYYCMKNINYVAKEHSRQWIQTFSKFEIPLPSIEVQNEIVEVLDKFDELLRLKQEELIERKKQYEYTKNKLLFNDSYSRVKVKDVCKITKGKSPIQKTIPGDYPMVVTTSERKTSIDYQFDTSAVCIPLVSSRGHGIASLNHVYYQEGKFALGNILCAVEVVDNDKLSAKYLYYFLENTKDFVLVPLMKGGANVSLHMNDIYDVELSLPNITEQDKIIEKLDTLLKYQEKLQLEIDQRIIQFSYYRNKLLSFEEAIVNE